MMPKRVDIDGQGVLICRTDDGFAAVDETCPHKQRSMRYGVVQRGQIICPHHRYKFDLETGRCHRRCAPVAVYDVEVIDDDIYVRRA